MSMLHCRGLFLTVRCWIRSMSDTVLAKMGEVLIIVHSESWASASEWPSPVSGGRVRFRLTSQWWLDKYLPPWPLAYSCGPELLCGSPWSLRRLVGVNGRGEEERTVIFAGSSLHPSSGGPSSAQEWGYGLPPVAFWCLKAFFLFASWIITISQQFFVINSGHVPPEET